MSECYSFVVNGVPCSTEEEKPLLRYLRDELRLTSVKDGCSEGACGTCTILVDGKAVKACVLSTKRAAGKEIVTVEGLSEAEREAFVYAFGAVGAVQCGFCIPGMVMAGKALLDQNPNPSEAEIKKAIRGNVCRCTGYKKIIEGIALAGAILRGEASVDPALEEGEDYGVGARAFRTDVRDKVLGRGEYCDDLYLDGMAHASAVRSQYPRARVLDIDPSAALALPGVLAVLTADDVPHNKVGHLQQDWDVMIAKGDITRCVGDAICLVVAENETVLKQAKELVKVDYEPLEPVRTIQEARAADAPILHPGGNLCQQRHVTRGDARAALAQSKYVVTQSYRTPFTEHAFLEPECAVAFPYKDGVKVYTSDQGVYDTRKEISIMLGWEPERIVVENKLVGGGFGGKEDVSVQHLAVLAALFFAAYAVLGKRQTARTGSLVVTCGSFLWGGLELGALLLLGRTEVGSALFGQLGLTMFQDVPFLQGLTGQTLPYFLFIGIVNTALGYVFHMLAIEKTSAIHGSLVFFFKPILAPLFALAVLGEAVTPPILLGIVCFLAGSLVSILPDILRARRAGQGRLAGEAAPQHEGKGR